MNLLRINLTLLPDNVNRLAKLAKIIKIARATLERGLIDLGVFFSRTLFSFWFEKTVLKANNQNKIRLFLDGASKFFSQSLKNFLLVEPDSMHNLLHVRFSFLQHHFSVAVEIEVMFLDSDVSPSD